MSDQTDLIQGTLDLLIMRAGKRQLETEVSKWERLSAGVNLVLERA